MCVFQQVNLGFACWVLRFLCPKDPFVCPKKGITPIILFWEWDLDHQSYSREGSGFLLYG